MPSPVWTPAQKAAIGYEGRNLLLSAAAGSGKTATLTERIVSLLTAPDSTAEISRMLAVTFTRAAAAELKERIGRALREAIAESGANARLSRQLSDLGRAEITTIHAFCLHILRPYFAELSLPAGFSIAEEAEIKTLSKEVMSDVITSFFTEGEADFLLLADTLSSARNESSLDGVLLDLAKSLSAYGKDAGDLKSLAYDLARMTAFFDSAAGAGTRVRTLRFAAHYRAYFADVCAEFSKDELFAARYLPAAEAAYALSDTLYDAARRGDYDGCREALLAYDPPKLGVVRAENQTVTSLGFKAARDAFKEEIARLKTRSFALTEEETAAVCRRTAEVSLAAARVLERYFDELSERKKERGVVDFADLEMLAVRLLVGEDGEPTPAAREIAARYDYIFIDEYQDTNYAQDAIFRAISQNCRRFMVGDIKQSIYRFRGAEPEVFAGYRRIFPPLSAENPSPDASIFMRENFRCDKTVVDFVNLVSRHVFSRGTIPFTKDDELAFSKSVPEGYEPHPVEIALLSKNSEEEGYIPEPAYVAERIAHLLKFGRRADGAPITPSDIAILLRSPGSDAAAFAEAIERRGIPVKSQVKASLYTQPEVLYVLSILRAVDNPGRDIDLAAAMRGPVFGFTLDDLVRIRRTTPAGSLWDAVRTAAGLLPPDGEGGGDAPDESLAERCRAFSEDLTALRTDARGMRADALILKLYAETGIEAIAAADAERDPYFAEANLRALYDAARVFENGRGGGLYPFLKTVEAAVEEGESAPADDGTPAVRIMSIHQSKGLEFLVCFLSRADKGRNTRDMTASLLFDPALGAVMRLTDEGGLVRCDTPVRRSVVAAALDAAIEEEMRILYVALTRARERLIVSAAVSSPEEMASAAEDNPAAPYFTEETVFTAPNYITWIVNAIAESNLRGEDTSSAVITVVRAADGTEGEAAEAPAEAEVPAIDGGAIEAMAKRILERVRLDYPWRHLASVPAKLTVSTLYPGILDDEGESAVGDPLSQMGERNAPPAFLSGKTELEASFAGTATHVFLQFADFDRLRENGAAAERDRMLRAGFFTKEMADAVRMDEIARFVGSDLFGRMLRATWIKREFRFNAILPAADFTTDEALKKELRAAKTEITVQGVIDALFEDEDGKIVLVDYKTDRLTKEEIADESLAAAKLVSRHKEQLGYYRAVCADMLGRPVDACLIYSLPLGGTVDVP